MGAALAEAQNRAEFIGKDSKNKFSNYDYTSSEAIIDASREILKGLSLSICPSGADAVVVSGDVWLSRKFTLIHSHGEKLESSYSFPVCPKKGTPMDKAWAAALTLSYSYFLRDLLKLPRGDQSDDKYHHESTGNDSARQKKSGGNSGGKDFPRYGSKNLDPRPAGVFKRPHPSQLEKPPTVGELMARAQKDFPSINETLILEADDFAVADSGEAGLEAKDAHKWQDLAVHKARDVGITMLNPNDQAFAFLAKRLQKARKDQEPKGEKKAAQRRGHHKSVQKQLIEG